MRKEQERTIKDQIRDLTPTERSCLDQLKAKWQRKNPDEPPIAEELYLRFARCSAFNERLPWRVLRKHDHKCHKRLSIAVLEQQLKSKVRFPFERHLGMTNPSKVHRING